MFRPAYAKADFLAPPQERQSGLFRSRSVSKAPPGSPKTRITSKESHSASNIPGEVHEDIPKLSDSATVFHLQIKHEKCLKRLDSAIKTCEEVGKKDSTELAENLSCTKIARLLGDYETKLRIWAFESCLDDLPDHLDRRQGQAVDFGNEILESLAEHLYHLEEQCRYPIRYTPAPTLEADSEGEYDEYDHPRTSSAGTLLMHELQR